MKLENSWKSKIGVADVNQALEMLRWPQLTSFSTLNTPSSPKLMIFPSTIKRLIIGYILPRKTVYHDILIYWIISCNISRYIMKWYIAIYHIGDISRDISIYSIYSIDYWQNWYIRKYYFRVIYRYITNITKIYHWYIEYFCKKIWFEIFFKYFALFYRIRYIEIYHFYEYIAKKTQMWYIMIYPNISHM